MFELKDRPSINMIGRFLFILFSSFCQALLIYLNHYIDCFEELITDAM